MRHWLPLLTLGLGACAPPGAGGTIVGDVLVDPPRPPGGRPLVQALGPNGHHILYLNFDGVTLKPNYDNAIQNHSSIAASVGRSITVPPFNHLDYSNQLSRAQVIADVVAQTSKFFAAYNVDLVTTRPGAGDYVMAAIGGDPSLINEPCQNGGCVAGIAPLDCSRGNGKIFYNDSGDVEVVYAFSATARYFGGAYGRKVMDLAVTIAQETAHAYGLGHSNNGSDIMYPQNTGMATGFLTGAYADGGNCANSVGTQDGHGLLLQILGKSMVAQDQQKPVVSVRSPASGATVPRAFSVEVNATDNVGVTRVELELAGAGARVTRRIDAPPWRADLTAGADGAFALSATAFDAAGNSAFVTINLTVKSDTKLPLGAACASDAQCASGLCAGAGAKTCAQPCAAGGCPAGQQCNAQRVCEPEPMPAAPGEVGAECTVHDDCNTKICAELSGRHFCTGACDPMDATTCPARMVCVDYGNDGFLCAYSYGSRGGCSAAPPPAAPTGSALLVLVGLAALALGRARRLDRGPRSG